MNLLVTQQILRRLQPTQPFRALSLSLASPRLGTFITTIHRNSKNFSQLSNPSNNQRNNNLDQQENFKKLEKISHVYEKDFQELITQQADLIADRTVATIFKFSPTYKVEFSKAFTEEYVNIKKKLILERYNSVYGQHDFPEKLPLSLQSKLAQEAETAFNAHWQKIQDTVKMRGYEQHRQHKTNKFMEGTAKYGAMLTVLMSGVGIGTLATSWFYQQNPLKENNKDALDGKPTSASQKKSNNA